jgi:hypothetical protein
MPEKQDGLGQPWFVLDYDPAYSPLIAQPGLGQSWFVLEYERTHGAGQRPQRGSGELPRHFAPVDPGEVLVEASARLALRGVRRVAAGHRVGFSTSRVAAADAALRLGGYRHVGVAATGSLAAYRRALSTKRVLLAAARPLDTSATLELCLTRCVETEAEGRRAASYRYARLLRDDEEMLVAMMLL